MYGLLTKYVVDFGLKTMHDGFSMWCVILSNSNCKLNKRQINTRIGKAIYPLIFVLSVGILSGLLSGSDLYVYGGEKSNGDEGDDSKETDDDDDEQATSEQLAQDKEVY